MHLANMARFRHIQRVGRSMRYCGAARSRCLAPARLTEEVRVFKLDSQDAIADPGLHLFISGASDRMCFTVNKVEEAASVDIGGPFEYFGAIRSRRRWSPEVQA
jgi:hypothetical protein